MADISIITVSYNSSGALSAMLATVPAGVRVIVVDNASSDDSVQIARSYDADVIELSSNFGFGAACNAGAKIADTEWIFFLNPDTLLNGNSLADLLLSANKHKDGVAFNPKIVDSEGQVYIRRRSILLSNVSIIPEDLNQDFELDILSGSALLCKKQTFEKIGGFDENIFLYHEDDDLCFRLKQHGNLYFLAQPSVLHFGAKSSSEEYSKLFVRYQFFAASRYYVLRKHKFFLPRLRMTLSALGRILRINNISDSNARAANFGYAFGVIKAIGLWK
jgi:GT2 family glycosyltransferase